MSLTLTRNGKVGTAPGTTTLGLYMLPSWPTGRTATPPGLPGTQVVWLKPNGSAGGLMGALAGTRDGINGFAAVAFGVAAGLLLYLGYHHVKA